MCGLDTVDQRVHLGQVGQVRWHGDRLHPECAQLAGDLRERILAPAGHRDVHPLAGEPPRDMGPKPSRCTRYQRHAALQVLHVASPASLTWRS
jgi:hypothetical protein